MLLHGNVGRLVEVDSLLATDDLVLFRGGVLHRVLADTIDTFVSAFKFTTVTTTPFTATDEDIILVNPDTLGANITINLPTSSSRVVGIYARPITVKHIGSTATYTVTIDPNGSEEVDRQTTASITQPQSLLMAPDGSDWWVI